MQAGWWVSTLPGWPLHLITSGCFVLLNSSRSQENCQETWSCEQEEVWGTDMRQIKGLGPREPTAWWGRLLRSSPEKAEWAVSAACECTTRCLCRPAGTWEHHASAPTLHECSWEFPLTQHSHSSGQKMGARNSCHQHGGPPAWWQESPGSSRSSTFSHPSQ